MKNTILIFIVTLFSFNLIQAQTDTTAEESWYHNHWAKNYLFLPSAYNMEKGEIRYQNSMLFLNQLSYGVSNNFSISASLLPIFGNGLQDLELLSFIHAKYTQPLVENKSNLAAGAIIMFAPTETGMESVKLFYGAYTYGSRDRNVTIGVGANLTEGKFQDKPVFTLASTYRLANDWFLMSESYIFDYQEENSFFDLGLDYGIHYAGFRWARDFGSIDAGGTFVPGFLGYIPIPTVKATISLSNRKYN